MQRARCLLAGPPSSFRKARSGSRLPRLLTSSFVAHGVCALLIVAGRACSQTKTTAKNLPSSRAGGKVAVTNPVGARFVPARSLKANPQA